MAGLSSELSLLQASDEEVEPLPTKTSACMGWALLSNTDVWQVQCLNQPSGQALLSHLNSTQPTCVYIFSQHPSLESEQLSCLQGM